MPEGLKHCPACGQTKALREFYRNRARPDGHQAQCKPCLDTRSRKWRDDNREHVAERSRRYNEANREQNAVYWREWARANPERVADRTQRYRARHPEAQRVADARRRAKRAGVPSTLTEAEWLAVLDAHDRRCAYCAQPYECIDHAVPLAKGGANTRDNVVPACQACNERKGRAVWAPAA